MKRRAAKLGQIFSIVVLATCLSCSPRGTPVDQSVLVGKWQRVDKPAISMSFLKDGTFTADVAGQRLLGGKYRLISGERIILDCDASSLKAGSVTNSVSLAGGELRIVPADGKIERYKRTESQ